MTSIAHDVICYALSYLIDMTSSFYFWRRLERVTSSLYVWRRLERVTSLQVQDGREGRSSKQSTP